MRPPRENLMFFDFFFFCPWGVSFLSERAFWETEVKGHGRGSSDVHSSVFFNNLHLYCLHLWNGFQVSKSFFFLWCHYNFIGEANNFMCLCFPLPFRVLITFVKPFSLLLLFWFMRPLRSLVFLLIIWLARARLLLIWIVWWSLMLVTRVVLVPPLILSRRTVLNNIGPISWRRGFSRYF